MSRSQPCSTGCQSAFLTSNHCLVQPQSCPAVQCTAWTCLQITPFILSLSSSYAVSSKLHEAKLVQSTGVVLNKSESITFESTPYGIRNDKSINRILGHASGISPPEPHRLELTLLPSLSLSIGRRLRPWTTTPYHPCSVGMDLIVSSSIVAWL